VEVPSVVYFSVSLGSRASVIGHQSSEHYLWRSFLHPAKMSIC
jgi:hypothetical protein